MAPRRGIIMLVTLALAAEPVIHDVEDARYLHDSHRSPVAAEWFLEDLDTWLVDYLHTLGQLPEYRSEGLVPMVRRWQADHPDRPTDGAIALAMAHDLATLSRSTWRGVFAFKGSWCAPAAAALATLPDDPADRYALLQVRIDVGSTCGTSTEADEQEARALALSGEAGPLARARVGLSDDVDDDDLAAVRQAVEAHPRHLRRLGHAFGEQREGPALEPVRALLIERARALAVSDRPAWVDAAATLLDRAGLPEEAHAARAHLAEIDPGNSGNAHRLATRNASPIADEVSPDSLVDPAQRLAALRALPVPTSRWERAEHLYAIADAALALGDVEAELDALSRLWPSASGTRAHVRYARATVAADRDLKKGAEAAEAAVASLRDPGVYGLPADEAAWRASLADALDARALVARARGREDDAIDDLEEALLLDGPDPDRLLRLGLLYADERGVSLLGRALAELPPDIPDRALAESRIAAWLAARPGWQPDVPTFVEGCAPPAPVEAADEPLDASLFADLVVRIGDEERRLLDLEGPVVVDVWATWCGPCTRSLPHLDTLARQYEGEVTFVALSVDDAQATADRYLERRGPHAFTNAFLPEGMKRIGVDGIPAMFVFDDEHRLVARLSGWGPGSTSLDDAVADMLR